MEYGYKKIVLVVLLKHAKKQLKHYIKRYELTLDAIVDGIWDWNLVTNEVYFSKRWKEMLGYEEDEFPNTAEAFFDAIHEDDRQKSQTMLEKHFQNPNHNIYSIEIRMKMKDGGYKWMHTRGKVTLDKYKKPMRMLGSHTENELKKLCFLVKFH